MVNVNATKKLGDLRPTRDASRPRQRSGLCSGTWRKDGVPKCLDVGCLGSQVIRTCLFFPTVY